MGRHDEIVFHPACIAVVHEVYSRIHLPVFDAGVLGYPGDPFLRVVTDQIVRYSIAEFTSPDLGFRVASQELHGDGRNRLR